METYLGDRPRAGSGSSIGWQDFGYDLDDLITTEHGSNHCRPAGDGSPPVDGPGGLDNAWGARVLPALLSVMPDLPVRVMRATREGQRTTIIQLTNFSGVAPDSKGDGRVYQGVDGQLLQYPMTWKIFDPAPALLDGYLVASPATAENALWVGRGSGVLEIRLGIEDGDIVIPDLVIPIHQPLVTFRVGTGEGGRLTRDGVVAGWVPVEELVAAVAGSASPATPDLPCPGAPEFERLADAIRGAADLTASGTNGDPNEPCEAVSIAIGFSGFSSALGDSVPLPPASTACAR